MTTQVQTPTYSKAGWSFLHERKRGPVIPGAVFDFDPAYSMTQDRAAGITLAQGGTGAVSLDVQRGRHCAVFNGSSYLLGSEAPFASLGDVSRVTSFVVAERTDAVNSQQSMFEIDASSGSAGQHVMYVAHNGSDLLVGGMADASAIVFGTQSGLTRNTRHVVSADFQATSIAARISSTGSASSVASRNPSSLDRLIIGGSMIFLAPAGSYTGRIWRVVSVLEAFSAEALGVLTGYYA